jgi:hypothetical protein
MELEFSIPTKDTPGYLRRQKKALEFSKAFSESKVTPEVLDDLVNFLSDFVSKPTDKNEVKELLWDASESQLIQLIDSISGSNTEVVPLAK